MNVPLPNVTIDEIMNQSILKETFIGNSQLIWAACFFQDFIEEIANKSVETFMNVDRIACRWFTLEPGSFEMEGGGVPSFFRRHARNPCEHV